jgi:hypothetical protein
MVLTSDPSGPNQDQPDGRTRTPAPLPGDWGGAHAAAAFFREGTDPFPMRTPGFPGATTGRHVPRCRLRWS